jgi:hypothetical protein
MWLTPVVLLLLLSAFAPASTEAQTMVFVHPGSLRLASDMSSSFALASQGREPWKTGLDKLIERVEGPNSLRAYEIKAPDDGVFSEANSDSLLRDADAAYTCALYWYTFKSRPDKYPATSACLSLTQQILRAWVDVQDIEDGNNFKFYLNSLLLAADLLGGGEVVSGFRAWILTVALPIAEASYNNVTDPTNTTFGPRGQNHAGWSAYDILLIYHLLDDASMFRTWAIKFTKFAEKQVDIGDGTTEFGDRTDGIADTSYNDATLGNERWRPSVDVDLTTGQRYNSGVVYTFIGLMPIVASMRVIRNVSGVDLFDEQPDVFDTYGNTGRNIRRAIQTAFYYQRHPERWLYGNFTNTKAFDNALHLFDIVSAIYQNADYANYAAPSRPFQFEVSGKFNGDDPHGTYLLSAATANIDLSPPGTHTFERDAAPYVVRNGSWGTAREPGSPSGNMVYRQTSLTTTAATVTAGDGEWMDYSLRARVRVNSFNGSTSGVGLFARYIDANNYYAFSWNAYDGHLRIEKRKDGVITPLVTLPFNFSSNAWYTFEVEVAGPRLDFRVIRPDGTPSSWLAFDEFTDTPSRHAFMAGKMGLQAHRADAMFDNVCVARSGGDCSSADRFLPPSLVLAVSGL